MAHDVMANISGRSVNAQRIQSGRAYWANFRQPIPCLYAKGLCMCKPVGRERMSFHTESVCVVGVVPHCAFGILASLYTGNDNSRLCFDRVCLLPPYRFSPLSMNAFQRTLSSSYQNLRNMFMARVYWLVLAYPRRIHSEEYRGVSGQSFRERFHAMRCARLDPPYLLL